MTFKTVSLIMLLSKATGKASFLQEIIERIRSRKVIFFIESSNCDINVRRIIELIFPNFLIHSKMNANIRN